MKKRPQRSRSRLFYQYLISYLCILLIPLLILSVFIYEYLFGILKREIQDNALQSLSTSRSAIEPQIGMLKTVGHRVFVTSVIDEFKLTDDTMKAIAAQKSLGRMRKNMPFLYDVIYYQENDDYAITSYSSCKKQLLFRQRYTFSQWDPERVFAEGTQIEPEGYFIRVQPVELPHSDILRASKDLLTYVLPLHDSLGQRWMIYLIRADYVLDVLPEAGTGSACLILDSATGQILMNTGNEDLIPHFPYNAFAQSSGQDYVNVDGTRYLMSRVDSEDLGWSFVSLIPAKNISGQMSHVIVLMTIMCLVAVSGGLLGIFLSMKQNYTPIQKLEKMTSSIHSTPPGDGRSGNEIDHVANVIHYLDRQNKMLVKDDAQKGEAVREQFLQKLLNGHYRSEEKLLEKARLAGVSIRSQFYQAAVFKVRRLHKCQDMTLEEILCSARPQGSSVLVQLLQEADQIRMVICWDTGSSARNEQYLQDVIRLLESDYGLHSIGGLGPVVTAPGRIAESYSGAAEALKYHLVIEDRKLITYDCIRDRKVVDIPVRPQELASYIELRDIEGMDQFLDKWQQEIRSSSATIVQLQQQCNRLIYTIENTIVKVNREYFEDEPLYSKIAAVMEYDNVSELLQIAHLIGCDIVNQMNEVMGNHVIDAMVQYVKENCYSCDFSTSEMAEKFKMSLPYLSSYFKANRGVNLQDYVTELKIERSKELLSQTDLLIKDIAEQVGYYNVNSFNRRFKQVTGVTPGEFRRNLHP